MADRQGGVPPGTRAHPPRRCPLLTALSALADPVRIQLVRDLAGHRRLDAQLQQLRRPFGKAAKSHHFSVLRDAGLVEQRDQGPKRVNRLRREEFDARFPGLLALVLRED